VYYFRPCTLCVVLTSYYENAIDKRYKSSFSNRANFEPLLSFYLLQVVAMICLKKYSIVASYFMSCSHYDNAIDVRHKLNGSSSIKYLLNTTLNKVDKSALSTSTLNLCTFRALQRNVSSIKGCYLMFDTFIEEDHLVRLINYKKKQHMASI